MVKTGAPVSAAETLTQALRAGGDDLLRVRVLTQKTPLQPLQLHDITNSVDHVLVTPGHKIAVISQDGGQAALAYSKLRPHWDITAWLPDMKSLMRAQNQYADSTIHFDKQPHQKRATDMKAILAITWAHKIFSHKNYSIQGLARSVQELIAELPDDGRLIIQDVGLGDDVDKFVFLEIQNAEAAEALIEFSHIARGSLSPSERGFFIETLPSPRAGVWRYRLPSKWASEFYQRWRLGITPDAPYEITTLPLEQWASLAEQCGGRVLYRAPHALKPKEITHLSATIRFLDEHENILPPPPASFTLVIEKLIEGKAATLYERRVAANNTKTLRLSPMKVAKDEKEIEVVETLLREDDLLPWRRDEEGNLRVWIRTHVPRPIINAVPRGTTNLDGRHWAGYLIEPLSVAATGSKIDAEIITDTLNEMTRLPKTSINTIRVGINYYPEPRYVAQRVRGIFVHVTNSLPHQKESDVIEVLADDVLRAISAGLIPDGKLEILISKLMLDLGVKPNETGDMLKDIGEIKMIKAHAQREARMARFSAKSGEKLNDFVAQDNDLSQRAVRSVFVEDHINPYGRETRNATEHDFIVPAKLSANTAVVLPLMRNLVGQYVFAAEPSNLPIPQRMGTDEAMLSLPSFRLPENLRSIDSVRAFLAKQFSCPVDDIMPMGPSFFLQPHLSAERVYPFLLRSPGFAMEWTRWYKPRNQLQRLIDPNVEKSTAFVEFKAARDLGQWYQGFSPELTHDVTQKTASTAAASAGDTISFSSNDNLLSLTPR